MWLFAWHKNPAQDVEGWAGHAAREHEEQEEETENHWGDVKIVPQAGAYAGNFALREWAHEFFLSH